MHVVQEKWFVTGEGDKSSVDESIALKSKHPTLQAHQSSKRKGAATVPSGQLLCLYDTDWEKSRMLFCSLSFPTWTTEHNQWQHMAGQSITLYEYSYEYRQITYFTPVICVRRLGVEGNGLAVKHMCTSCTPCLYTLFSSEQQVLPCTWSHYTLC